MRLALDWVDQARVVLRGQGEQEMQTTQVEQPELAGPLAIAREAAVEERPTCEREQAEPKKQPFQRC